jgi:transcription-repair coupling factor (superfamily II helicase)
MSLSFYHKHTYFNNILKLIELPQKKLGIKNLVGSAFNLLITEIFNHIQKNILVIYPDKEMAMYGYTDALNILNNNSQILFLPSSYKKKIKNLFFDNALTIIRNETINQIKNLEKSIVFTYPEALAEKIIDKDSYLKNTIEIKVNDNIDSNFLIEFFDSYNFEQVDYVYQPGQYAVRGAIIDVFSYASEYPYRIELDEDYIKSLRTFSIENQQSLKFLDKIEIIPDFFKNFKYKITSSFFDYYKSKPLVFTYDAALFKQLIADLSKSYFYKDDETENIPVLSVEEFFDILKTHTIIEHGFFYFPHDEVIKFNTIEQPAFNKNFELLKLDIETKFDDNYSINILVENNIQKDRLIEIFKNLNILNKVNFLDKTLNKGFIDNDFKIALYTEHQIFDRFYKHKVRDRFLYHENIIVDQFNSLKPGDYVVHIDHGIGIFAGLEKIEINGKWQEQIKIVFKDNACIYMSVHNLHKISKYKGADGTPPKLSKLGSGAWQKLKNIAKQKVKDIAKDLIKIYAERMHSTGYKFSPDTFMQEELEASFFYEDTPDQAKATRAVKEDMEKEYPMDRLICGDVGFGKTEIAIRAAFKAVADNKQVAVLVPTTILALQHYLTFTERLEKFPCKIDYLSRLKNIKQTKETLEKLKKGEIDIIIGTHKLLSDKVQFKDLGLLIIDEEQKFGVAAKEYLRKIKTNVDTLTLTATPIPRTLQFSLMGARDISILQTPPANRQPIHTEVHVFNTEIIKKAIEFEVSRDGQVFFIHNKVNNINDIKKLIQQLCPDVNVAVAHGKMSATEMEEIILDFMQGKYDVLVSTTIIENGIDIPNANTIIINNGHTFGLSDLHQLRGRVGRTNRKAYCYILTPPLDSIPNEAKKRLKAIEEYSELGSGFYIAMQDLDIRGAGNLLGAEQSGFIAEMGFETYQKILQEAIEELRLENSIEKEEGLGIKNKFLPENCIFESDLELYIPETYIENTTERIKIYRELDLIETEDELAKFENKLLDRYGPIPEEVKGLFKVIQLRWLANSIGFEKISLRNNKLTCYFNSNKQSSYFESNIFKNILTFLQKNTKGITLKESKERLFLQFENVKTLEKAKEILVNLKNEVIT